MLPPEEIEHLNPYLDRIYQEFDKILGDEGTISAIINEAKEETGYEIHFGLDVSYGVSRVNELGTKEPRPLVKQNGEVGRRLLTKRDRKWLRKLCISVNRKNRPK